LYVSMGRIFSWEVGIAFHNFRSYTEWLKLYEPCECFGKKADEIWCYYRQRSIHF
jgi:hypothetical protein